MYATLVTSYQLLSRSPHARPRLSRSMFQYSKIWTRMKLDQGQAPMPIFTAVRVKDHNDCNTTKAGQEVSTEITMQKNDLSIDFEKSNSAFNSNGAIGNKYQWWEMNPLEVGSSDEGAWVPTWSYGRLFNSGSSMTTLPEISMSLLLGQATCAPAGPLTGYISTMLATLRKGTIMSYLLSKVNTFIQHKRWEKRWGNPIRGADEPNPLYGRGKRCTSNKAGSTKDWENKKRLKLMDSGLSNNLPNRECDTQNLVTNSPPFTPHSFFSFSTDSFFFLWFCFYRCFHFFCSKSRHNHLL